MILNRLSFILLTIFIVGCDNEKNSTENEFDTLPTETYEEVSELSGFNLSRDYIYWEVRRSYFTYHYSSENEGEYEYGEDVLHQYDEAAYNNLTPLQLEMLEGVNSVNGFDDDCPPDYCPIFGVALLSNEPVVIASEQSLLEFFGDIDTPAELSRWVWANDYSLKFYEETNYGYRVVADWDNDCGERGQDLIKVFKDGSIEKVEELSIEFYDTCA